ncbi:MAG: redox-sensing transcriptional repressor Rex [Anaerolineaceae bacterium]|nr:redox-sensing transcriptional repressor Rex [Anaerolineaceae bacterium]
MNSAIPSPSLRRLPKYYRELKRAMDQGISYMNSAELGKALGIPSTQVRKDLSYLSEQGRPGVGYNTRVLAQHLKEFLGLVKEKQAALVGVGNLANALVPFPGFKNYGLTIHVLFDNDPDKIGTVVNGREVLAIQQLAETIQRMNIHIGIITTPAPAAQEVADMMIAGGIKAIWNFAPVTLKAPDSVYILNQDLASELAVLSYFVQGNEEEEEESSEDEF